VVLIENSVRRKIAACGAAAMYAGVFWSFFRVRAIG
jgi:hypothetical protein